MNILFCKGNLLALDQANKDNKPNVKKQDEAQLSDKDDVALPLSYIVFFFIKMKKLDVTAHLIFPTI